MYCKLISLVKKSFNLLISFINTIRQLCSLCLPDQTHPASLSTRFLFYCGGGGGVCFAQSPSLVSDRFSLHVVNIETLKLFRYLNTFCSNTSYPKNNLLTIIIWVECLYHHGWVKCMKLYVCNVGLTYANKTAQIGAKIVSYSRCTSLSTLIIGKNKKKSQSSLHHQ